jgi:hypothetical protein
VRTGITACDPEVHLDYREQFAAGGAGPLLDLDLFIIVHGIFLLLLRTFSKQLPFLGLSLCDVQSIFGSVDAGNHPLKEQNHQGRSDF